MLAILAQHEEILIVNHEIHLNARIIKASRTLHKRYSYLFLYLLSSSGICQALRHACNKNMMENKGEYTEPDFSKDS